MCESVMIYPKESEDRQTDRQRQRQSERETERVFKLSVAKRFILLRFSTFP
jgi:hypothetical protein